MFKLITATVDNDWLRAKQISKHDFLDSIQNKGCKVLLNKSSISIECSFNQLQELYSSYDDDNSNESQDAAEDEQPGLSSAVTDRIILDGYMWDYMDQVYGNEISIMKEKYNMSVEAGDVKNGLVTVTLKPKGLRTPVDVMAVQERILEMRDYLNTLQSFVLSTVSVESVNVGRLERSHFRDISEYFEAKYRDVVLKRTNNGFRIIGPKDSCDAIKKRFSETSPLSQLPPLKNHKYKKASLGSYRPDNIAVENIDFGSFIKDWGPEEIRFSEEDERDQNLPPREYVNTSKLMGELKAELECSEETDEESEERVAHITENNLPTDDLHLQTHETSTPSDDDDNSNDTAIFENAKLELYTSLGQSRTSDKHAAEEFEQETNNSQTLESSNMLNQSLSTKHYEADEHDEDLEITDAAEIEVPKKARKKLPNIAYIADVAPEKPETNVKKTSKREAKERLQFDSESDYSD